MLGDILLIIQIVASEFETAFLLESDLVEKE
jgi:hypothetical protein